MSAVVDHQIASFREKFQLVQREIGRVIVGQRQLIDRMLVSLVARGHVLELCPAVLRRWYPGRVRERARVVLRGLTASPPAPASASSPPGQSGR